MVCKSQYDLLRAWCDMPAGSSYITGRHLIPLLSGYELILIMGNGNRLNRAKSSLLESKQMTINAYTSTKPDALKIK